MGGGIGMRPEARVTLTKLENFNFEIVLEDTLVDKSEVD